VDLGGSTALAQRSEGEGRRWDGGSDLWGRLVIFGGVGASPRCLAALAGGGLGGQWRVPLAPVGVAPSVLPRAAGVWVRGTGAVGECAHVEGQDLTRRGKPWGGRIGSAGGGGGWQARQSGVGAWTRHGIDGLAWLVAAFAAEPEGRRRHP
jgi:hypothetical protein